MTAENAAIENLVRNTVARAMELPYRESQELLRGLLLLGGEYPAIEPVRAAYHALHETSQQLELLTSGDNEDRLDAVLLWSPFQRSGDSFDLQISSERGKELKNLVLRPSLEEES